MGLESGSNKPIQQGEAGFLTQDQLDELNGTGSEPEAVEATVEAPKVEEGVNMSFANLGTENALTAPLSPERRAEVMEQITEEETRLDSNLQKSDEVTKAAEARISDPAMPESKKMLTYAKIAESYKKTRDRLLAVTAAGMSGGLLAATAGFMAGEHSRTLNAAMDMQEMMTNHWNHLGENLVNGGTMVAIASGAALGIGKTMAWLKMRSQEKKLYA